MAFRLPKPGQKTVVSLTFTELIRHGFCWSIFWIHIGLFFRIKISPKIRLHTLQHIMLRTISSVTRDEILQMNKLMIDACSV